MTNSLPFSLVTVGVFLLGYLAGTVSTYMRRSTKQKRHRRRYANYGAHYVGTPPPADGPSAADEAFADATIARLLKN